MRRETEDCVSVDFEVPAELSGVFRFTPGQYLTLRTEVDGEELRRSYSICSGPQEEALRVAIKHLPGGRFSSFANEQLKAGDVLEVMAPYGRFTLEPDPQAERSYVAFAAGSGITPVLSILKSVLQAEPNSNFTLFYGNRSTDSIIFREELEDLKNRFLGRLRLHYVLSREHPGSDHFFGRIDREKVDFYLDRLLDPESVDAFYLCGPEAMIHTVRDALAERDVPEKQVRFELFGTGGGKKKTTDEADDAPEMDATVEIRLDGNQIEFPLNSRGETILDAALRNGADLPFACKGGVCSTCRARLVEGEIKMDLNYALEPDEVAAGFILTCQAHPRSAHVKVDFDA